MHQIENGQIDTQYLRIVMHVNTYKHHKSLNNIPLASNMFHPYSLTYLLIRQLESV